MCEGQLGCLLLQKAFPALLPVPSSSIRCLSIFGVNTYFSITMHTPLFIDMTMYLYTLNSLSFCTLCFIHICFSNLSWLVGQMTFMGHSINTVYVKNMNKFIFNPILFRLIPGFIKIRSVFVLLISFYLDFFDQKEIKNI